MLPLPPADARELRSLVRTAVARLDRWTLREFNASRPLR
ncbi:hypothetical protein CLV35_3258 [Motilibacter peucedani]|uniref:Uncharacterized protein n=1 Tax=Motilibacter peucedani TaxID=598650 RepID=A0A420XMF2_9ACTN|nr:hypothetical protein CLV35_3258 [Motilibacter peucedani]